jgi:hypothetical protein
VASYPAHEWWRQAGARPRSRNCLSGHPCIAAFLVVFLLPAGSPSRLVGGGEVVPRRQRIRVVLAQHPLAVGEGGGPAIVRPWLLAWVSARCCFLT